MYSLVCKVTGICLLALVLVATTNGQQPSEDFAPNVISGRSTFASPYSNGLWGQYFPRLSVQHRTEGAGYYSFTDFRTWVPLYESSDAKSLTFFDGAFLLANDQNVGLNAVVGQRFFLDNLGRTVGGYVGYDNRDTGHQTVGQVVTGLESLGQIDFRVNGYFPTSSEPTLTGQSGFFDPTYSGYNIQLSQLNQYEVAMKGFDTELGGALPHVGDYLRAYLGTYNFQASGSQQAWGVKARLESHITDTMRFYVTASNDQVFDTNVVFGAAFFFPGSSARRAPRYDSYVNKMDEPLIRNEAVVVNKVSRTSKVNATNTATGTAQQVIHVDPNATVTGNGTVGNPYNSLQLAEAGSQPHDIIFIHPRADDTATNLTQTLTLQENQRLLASTHQHTFTATQGTYALPGYEVGIRPTLDSAGSAIVLASGNEVSGFRFDHTGSDSIFGNGVNGFNINNNTFNHVGTLGEASIFVQNASGTGVIRDNTISNLASVGDGGIFVELADTANLLIDDNTLTRALSAGGSHGIQVDVLSGVEATVNITNNELTNTLAISGHGIHLNSAGNLTGSIANNDIRQGLTASEVDYGIFANITDGTSTLEIENNTIRSFLTADGLDTGIYVDISTNGGTTTYITNNTVSDFLTLGIFDEGILYASQGTGTNNLVLTGNTVNHSGGDVASYGYAISVGPLGTLNANIQNNTASGSFFTQSMLLSATDNATFNMRMLDNTLSDDVVLSSSDGARINFEVFNGQTVPFALSGINARDQNTITGNAFIFTTFGGTAIRVAPNSLPIPE